ncbi:MAG: hypothetical protein E6G46_10520 [Actinobacteria bacterium]|nr:MAG: hypothetical protein E6G46_10520 [Actinomycetota bacterium]
MPTVLQSTATLHRSIEAVQSARNVDRAVNRLAVALSAMFHISRVNVRMYLAQSNEVIVVGAWCAHPSSILPGVRMRASSTSFLDVVLEHGVVCGPRAHMKELTEDVVYDGVGSWVSVPIPGGFRPDGVLTVASASGELKKEMDFFTQLGDAVGSRLALLGKASAVYLRTGRGEAG